MGNPQADSCIVPKEHSGATDEDTKMNSTLSEAARTGKHTSLTIGVVLIVSSLLAAMVATHDVRLAFAPLAFLAIIGVSRFVGVGSTVPREPIGWLYAVIVFVTCWAPSLGTAGTIARFGIAGVALAALIVISQKNETPLPALTKLGISVLILSLAISAVGAASSGYGAARILNWVMFIPLVWLVYRRPHVKGMIFGIVATCVFQMAGVGLQMAGFMGGTWGGLLTSGTTYNPETSSWLRRYTGFIANPNNLALLLACGVIVLAACLLSQITVRLKVACLALIGLFVVGVVMTGSRGGLVAVGLGLMALFIAAGRRGVAAGILAASLALVALQLGPTEELDRVVVSFSEILSGTDASASQRSDVWMTRLGAANESDLALGSGFGGYAPSLFANQQGLDIDGLAARTATVDNSWLKLLLESGLLGAAGLATTLLYPMFAAFFRSSGSRRLWGIASGSVILALIWRSISVDMLDQNPWNAITFLAIGFATAAFGTKPTKSTAVFRDEPKYLRSRPISMTVR